MNTRYHTVLEEIKKLEASLNPPPYEVSNDDHVKAYFRYFFENFLYERVHDLSSFVEFFQVPQNNQPPSKIKHIEERATKSKEELKYMFFSSTDKEYWEQDPKTNQAMLRLAQGLNYGHYGECIDIPQVCERCLAERIYRLPSTQTWETEDGMYMYANLKKLKEMEQRIKLAHLLDNELPKERLYEQNQKEKI